jgi:hypothetical protein
MEASNDLAQALLSKHPKPAWNDAKRLLHEVRQRAAVGASNLCNGFSTTLGLFG